MPPVPVAAASGGLLIAEEYRAFGRTRIGCMQGECVSRSRFGKIVEFASVKRACERGVEIRKVVLAGYTHQQEPSEELV